MQRKLTPEMIDKVFADAKHQADYVIGLYRIAYPDFDNIAHVDGFPSISHETADYIFKKAIDFDAIHHPDVVKGGAWLNNGFTVDDVTDWTVIPCEVTYKKENKR